MSSKELILSQQDLTSAGISSQLTTNDLVEVVANEIYNNYMDALHDCIARGNSLYAKYNKLLTAELKVMRKKLRTYFDDTAPEVMIDDENIENDEYDDDFKGVATSFGPPEGYWGSIGLWNPLIKEKDRGTIVEKDTHSMKVPNLKSKTARVKLTMSTGTVYDKIPVKLGSISGEINNSTNKTFTQIISVSISRFKQYEKDVHAHNAQVNDLLAILPKTGAISVERFTREARVKMNKNILSTQSADFKRKMSELFNIKF